MDLQSGPSEPRARRHRRRRAAGAWLAAALCAACSQSPAQEAGRFERLSLHWLREGVETPRSRSVRAVLVPEELARFDRDVDEPVRVLAQDDLEIWMGRNGGQLRLLGPLDPRSFNRVEVLGRFRSMHRTRLELGGEPPEVITRRVSGRAGNADGELQTLVFDLPGLRGSERDLEHLSFVAQGPDCEIYSLELMARPAQLNVPPLDEPRLVEIGGRARRGVGLWQGRQLVADVAVQAGDELGFSFGVPATVRAEGLGRALALRVRVESDAHEAEHEFAFDVRPAEERAWAAGRLSLERFEGHAVRVSFGFDAEAAQLGACVLADAWVGSPDPRARSVLLITSDTHRADYLGAAHSGVEVQTPTLDALAERAVLFEDCFSSSNITSPSHSAILTGFPPRDTGIVDNYTRLSRAAYTLGEAFLDAGYRTFCVLSADHLGPDGSDVGQGFDRLAEPNGLPWPGDRPISILEDWLDDAEGQPLFIWLHLFDAHSPYEPPGRFDRMYYDAQRDPFDPALPALELSDARLPIELQGRGLRDLAFPEAQYRSEVSFLDEQLQRVLEHPRLAGAITAFTADHGEIMIRPDGAFHHSRLLPDTLHVPLMIAWPGAPAGTRVSEPVKQIHLGRTLLDLAGLQASEFPGRSLLPEARASARVARPRFALGSSGAYASAASEHWFLVLDLADGEQAGLTFERHRSVLYDLRSDPACLVDVSGTELERTRRLRALLVQWLNDVQGAGLQTSTDHSEARLEQLRALGYAAATDTDGERVWFDESCACERCEALR